MHKNKVKIEQGNPDQEKFKILIFSIFPISLSFNILVAKKRAKISKKTLSYFNTFFIHTHQDEKLFLLSWNNTFAKNDLIIWGHNIVFAFQFENMLNFTAWCSSQITDKWRMTFGSCQNLENDGRQKKKFPTYWLRDLDSS